MNKPWLKRGLTAGAMTLALVCGFEGERLTAYMDIGGTPSICEGKTQGVYPGMTATHQQCLAWAGAEIQHDLDTVDRLTVVRQPDTRRAALADFAYNEGSGALQRSRALQLINRGQIRAGCAALMNWRYAGGKELAGLVRRRAAETELCLIGAP